MLLLLQRMAVSRAKSRGCSTKKSVSGGAIFSRSGPSATFPRKFDSKGIFETKLVSISSYRPTHPPASIALNLVAGRRNETSRPYTSSSKYIDPNSSSKDLTTKAPQNNPFFRAYEPADPLKMQQQQLEQMENSQRKNNGGGGGGGGNATGGKEVFIQQSSKKKSAFDDFLHRIANSKWAFYIELLLFVPLGLLFIYLSFEPLYRG